MLSTSIAALAVATALISEALAQEQYTVWSSVIFSRTGERTPRVLGYLPTVLTSFGAQQSYQMGQFYRERYITSAFSDNSSSSGIDLAPIQGLSALELDVLQVYVGALDFQYSAASAQAFVQGLYPPYQLTGNNGTIDELLDPTSVLANGSYIVGPLSGYQYAHVHTPGFDDPEFVYLGGDLLCPGLDTASGMYASTPEFARTEADSKSLYQDVGQTLLSDVLQSSEWDYLNAWAIYDYLVYQNAHNATAEAYLQSDNKMDRIKYLSDQQQWAQLGNISAENTYTGVGMPEVITGSVATIAGNMLAYRMLYQLQQAIASEGVFYKLSLLFGDFEPLVSLFAVAQLANFNTDFYGMPNFASTAVLELFSLRDRNASASFPDPSELQVRFYFKNGTDDGFQGYSILGNGPDGFTMRWQDFENAMWSIALGDVGDWCTQCGGEQIFCAAWNSSDTASGIAADSSSSSKKHHSLSPAVAGVIGAVVTLIVAALLFGLIMLLGGVRLHRVARSHKKDMGGFKGGQKMQSDQDLTVPKGMAGASVQHVGSGGDGGVGDPNNDSAVAGGHERVGSWELKQAETGRVISPGMVQRPSFEDDDRHVNPFADPVKADERV